MESYDKEVVNEKVEAELLEILNNASEPIPLSEADFKQLLASAYSTLQVSTRKGL